eukprot:COSAG06_NODE_58197_length_277_cov_5564.960674_1_plen_70_part_01
MFKCLKSFLCVLLLNRSDSWARRAGAAAGAHAGLPDLEYAPQLRAGERPQVFIAFSLHLIYHHEYLVLTF